MQNLLIVFGKLGVHGHLAVSLVEGAVPKREGGALPRPLAWMEKFALKRMQLKQFCVDEPKSVHQNKVGQIKRS